MEARRREKERPWLQLLALSTCAAAVLLTALLWRMQHLP
jgi:cytoskeletal protein RodZ